MARYVALIAGFALLVVVFWVGLQRDPSALPSPFINQPAPEFELPTLKDPDARVSTESLMGNIALVNVWATWCVGCREEHPFLMELAESGTIPIYGINWRDDRSDALRWLDQFGDPYIASGFDGDGRVGIDWGVYGAPETFLIDANGVVLHKHLGPLSEPVWQRDFVPLIEAAGSS